MDRTQVTKPYSHVSDAQVKQWMSDIVEAEKRGDPNSTNDLDDRNVVNMTDTTCLKPAASLLCKLGSIVVHLEEMNSRDGHAFDKIALDALTSDPEVADWISEMQGMAMVPVKRSK